MLQLLTKWRLKYEQYLNIQKSRKEIKRLRIALMEAIQRATSAEAALVSAREENENLTADCALLTAKLERMEVIDPNMRCLACGQKQGSIKSLKGINREIKVEHTCGVCGYQWQESTVRADADEFASWNATSQK